MSFTEQHKKTNWQSVMHFDYKSVTLLWVYYPISKNLVLHFYIQLFLIINLHLALSSHLITPHFGYTVLSSSSLTAPSSSHMSFPNLILLLHMLKPSQSFRHNFVSQTSHIQRLSFCQYHTSKQFNLAGLITALQITNYSCHSIPLTPSCLHPHLHLSTTLFITM